MSTSLTIHGVKSISVTAPDTIERTGHTHRSIKIEGRDGPVELILFSEEAGDLQIHFEEKE